MKKILSCILYILTSVYVFLVSFVGFSALWGLTTWGDLDVDEILFQLSAPLEGTGNGMILDYVLKGLVPAILVFAVFMIVLIKARGARRKICFSAICLLLCIFFSFKIKNYVWNRLNVEEWLSGQQSESSFIEDNYADPNKVKLTFPENRRNLIQIYLESMETTYADPASGGAFEKSCIPELTKLAMENEDFSGATEELNGGTVFPGMTNTMSAIFAHSTGLPLKADVGINNMDTQNSFFPNVTSIGDILQDEGYNQVFLLGSNATFGGRRLFFTEHGNFDIRDYVYAKESGWIPKDYKVFWGYEDQKLFEFAKETLGQLSKEDAPFNLTILTVDTHFEDGYVCDLCDDEFGDNQYANVMACSSRQVTEFIKWVQDQDFYDQTTIMLTGDHTTMDTDFCVGITPGYARKTYTAYINSAVSPADPQARREYCSMDSFPTTLSAMGVDIEGDRLALGTDLFSGRQTLTEEYGADVERQELVMRSPFLMNLEKTDLNSDVLMDRIREKTEISLESYDPATGDAVLKVIAPGFQIPLNYIRAEYRRSGQDKGERVKLMLREGKMRTYVGTINLSGWEKDGGEILFSLHTAEGTIFEDIISRKVSDLMEQNE